MDTNRSGINGRQKASVTTIDGFIHAAPIQRRASEYITRRPVARASVAKDLIKPIVTIPQREPVPLPRYTAPKRPARIVRKRLPIRRRILQSVGTLVAVLLLTGGFLFWKGYVQLHKVFHGTGTVAALSSKPIAPSQLKGEGDGRINILLLGIGGAGHEGPDLTDTLVVLSIDPVNNTAAFLSVPRDLWVKMPVNYFGNYQKINAAYESGKYNYLGKVDQSSANASAVEAGFSSVDQAVSQVLGITINYHMLVDFQAFRQAVDTVGGISMDVTDQLYDPTMAWENGNNAVLAPAGVQVMNGKKALLYARSRETSSDFARTQRQRQILLALKDKVLTAGTLSNPAKIDGLMNAFGDNVYSDLSTQGAERLYSIMKKINNSKISSVGLADPPNNFVTTDSVGNISVVRPRAGFNNYTDIQTYVRSQLVDGYILKEHGAITVLAPTADRAAATAAELKTYGYSVTASKSAVSAGFGTHPTLIDLSGGKDPYTRNYLEQRYGVKAIATLPAGVSVQPGSAKFVIIVTK